MKINITVAWSNTVRVEFDESRLKDEGYLDEIRNQAVQEASSNITWKDGMVTDCEEVPALIE